MVHIGIIPDGNRRWCRKNDMNLNKLVNHWLYNILFKFAKEAINDHIPEGEKFEINNYKLENINDYIIQKDIIRFTQKIQEYTNKKITEEGFAKSVIYKLSSDINDKYKDIKEITELSVYLSSIDNMQRKDDSIILGYELIKKIDQIFCKIQENLYKCNIKDDTIKDFLSCFKINLIGEKNKIPKDIKEIFEKFNKYTGDNVKFRLNIALVYDYKNDLIEDKRGFYKRDQSDIDLIFRSGGQMRLSGFFPTKVLYSELYFLDKLWPDIELKDFIDCMKEFKQRTRRFGK